MAYIKKHTNPTLGTSFTIEQNIKGKMHTFYVKDLGLDWNTKYKYRSISKCRAGFLTINSGEGLLCNLFRYDKNKLFNVEIQLPGSDFYISVLNMKNNKFLHIDKTVIENLTIGDIHSTFPNMADYNHWKSIGSKTWAGLAYGELKDTFENTTIKLVA
jgi:hypothetical protein